MLHEIYYNIYLYPCCCCVQGDEMLHEIYYNIGRVEVEDQIDVTTQLVNLYPFIGS